MHSVELVSIAQLDTLTQADKYLLILKHNTTCPISKGVLQRLQSDEAAVPEVDALYVLDLLQHRDLSNEIADRFGVQHQSPQLLAIRDGKCVYTEWGYDINAEAIAEALSS